MLETTIFGKDRTGADRNLRMDASRRLGFNYHYRDITSTGFATLTRAQEGAVLAAPASTWLDLVEVTCANSSSNAISVQIRAGTAGGVQDTITIPANNTIVVEYIVPKMQDEQAATWTAQVTGTTDQSDSPITIGMTAIQNT